MTTHTRQTAPTDAPDVAPGGGWLTVPCPLCGSTQQTLVFEAVGAYFGTRSSASVRRCVCGMQLTNPQPRGEALAAFYASDQYYTHERSGRAGDKLRELWQRLQLRGPLCRLRLWAEQRAGVRRWAKRFAPEHFPLTKGATLLDFGCGNGVFLRLARGLGLRAIGVEPDAAARAEAARFAPVAASLEQADALYAPQVAGGQESAAAAMPRYDRIILRHVLEHLPEPLATLRELSKRLAPEGRVLIGVPNADSSQAAIFGPFWLGYDLPRHLWHFTPATLRRVVEQAGLRCIHVETVEVKSFAEVSMQSALSAGAAPLEYDARDAAGIERAGRGAEVLLVAGAA